jgi:molybdopterin synthase sulfur carrier subunit
MTEVYLPRSLLALFPAAERRPTVQAETVRDVIDRLDERWPGMRARLLDAGPAIREHINVFVDGEPADLDTPVGPGSTVHAVSGGTWDQSSDTASTDQIGGRNSSMRSHDSPPSALP